MMLDLTIRDQSFFVGKGDDEGLLIDRRNPGRVVSMSRGKYETQILLDEVWINKYNIINYLLAENFGCFWNLYKSIIISATIFGNMS